MNFFKFKIIWVTVLFFVLISPFFLAEEAFAAVTLQKVRVNGLGLIGYWTLDGNDINWGSNTSSDRSGQGNIGTIINMSTTSSPATGKIGQTLNFDGNNDFISAPINLSGQML